MKNNNFETITDAYQLLEGARIKGKEAEEIFELGDYDALKKGYILYPTEEGIKFSDFSVVVSENELMDNFLIEVIKVDSESDDDLSL